MDNDKQLNTKEIDNDMDEEWDEERKISLTEFLRHEWKYNRREVYLYILAYIIIIAVSIFAILTK